MKASRYANSRQKSCNQCSDSKSKCDRKQGRCTRCTQRDLSCIYPGMTSPGYTQNDSSKSAEGSHAIASRASASLPSPSSDLSASAESRNPALPDHIVDIQTVVNGRDLPTSSILSTTVSGSCFPNYLGSNAPTIKPEEPEILDFRRLDLICPITVDDIRNRWLNPYIPGANQSIKEYPVNVTRFICRVLKSYAAVAARGRATLPFIHQAQMRAPALPLATCLSLARISEDPLPGSEEAASLVLQREMKNIAQEHENYDDMSLLSAFQAYLIYTLILFFRLNQGPSPVFRSAMMTLQELACSSSRRGLVCMADATHTRPRWEEWIVTEAKRRTLYVMYLLDSVLSADENLPTFLGTELRGLPAPSTKSLWQACRRSDWEKEYNIFLAEWADKSLTIDELWPIVPELSDADIVHRRRRVDQWLEDLDEFGTMIFAVTGCTHGG